MYMSAVVRALESYRLASQCLGKDRQLVHHACGRLTATGRGSISTWRFMGSYRWGFK